MELRIKKTKIKVKKNKNKLKLEGTFNRNEFIPEQKSECNLIYSVSSLSNDSPVHVAEVWAKC